MVKMLTSTYYGGKQYKRGESYSIDKKTEERWVKNRIAAQAEHQRKAHTEYQHPTPEYNSMTDEQLAEIVTKKRIGSTKSKTREQLIKMLEK